MKPYSKLGTAHRTEPCIGYPGQWLVYENGNNERSFATFEAAYAAAMRSDAEKTSVCWCASDNDPRIGEVWFTGFYQHGYFDQFGRYRS